MPVSEIPSSVLFYVHSLFIQTLVMYALSASKNCIKSRHLHPVSPLILRFQEAQVLPHRPRRIPLSLHKQLLVNA
jgi:hypothetical protein